MSTNVRSGMEVHRNGAVVAYRYSKVVDLDEAKPTILEERELESLRHVIAIAASLYQAVSYTGPLIARLEIECPKDSALRMVTQMERHMVSLEPNGTSLQITLEPDAQDVIADPADLVDDLAEELIHAFGEW